ncbi:MAG: FHA domain-containing protein [Dehalococcoidia bacterium]
MKIGRATDCWLVLPGDDVAEAQAEITLQTDRRLTVRHLGGDSGTWKNRARIISGVLREEDILRIGTYLLRLRTQASLPETDGAELQAVVVVEENLAAEAPEDTETGEMLERSGQFADGSFGPRARRIVCIVIVALAAIYWVSSMVGSGLSPDMPRETAYHCPVDGTVWRASWSAGPPKCPDCGQLCFGSISYQPKPTSRPATSTAPTATKTAVRQLPPAPPERGPGGQP